MDRCPRVQAEAYEGDGGYRNANNKSEQGFQHRHHQWSHQRWHFAYTTMAPKGEGWAFTRAIALGLHCITVLDVSREALARAATRLGAAGQVVSWLAADVTTDWPVPSVDFWHDRAVFHFLVGAEDRIRYINRLRSSVKRGGSVVMSTFALDGPPTCSGLPVMRYAPQTLAAELGDEFLLLDGRPAQHVTPGGRVQSFQYSRFKRV